MPSSLLDIPPDDPRVYDMISRADTVGVFQIESRAQMSMLPRLRPRNFYDLVIEVAIVRPGPIQGGMVHPYLRRRDGLEPVEYPSEAVRGVLAKTLGVPLFQEQVMRLAVVAAGFSPGEADQLRRAMGAWRRSGEIQKFQLKLMKGMLERGYTREFAERIYRQIQGFGEYGFPESHAASFALLVYASAWLKYYHPAAFCGAILNSLPMGFYAPAQLIRDAIAHGVRVLPVDVNASGWECGMEDSHGATEPRSHEERRHEGTEARRHGGEEERHAGTEARRHGGESIRTPHASEGPAGGNREEGTGNREEGTGNREEGRGNREEGTGNRNIRTPHASEGPAGAEGEHDWRRIDDGSDAERRREAAHSSPSCLRASVPSCLPPCLRLGFRLVRGLSEAKVAGLLAARREGPIASLEKLALRGDVSRETLLRLAAADAFRSLGLSRRDALWRILALDREPLPLLAGLQPDEPPPNLPAMTLDETVMHDYDALGLSLNAHPIGLVREELTALRVGTAAQLGKLRNRQRAAVAGLVTHRQRPSTAKGIVFMTLEDETGSANLIVHGPIWERDAHIARARIALIAEGHVERQGEVIHVVVSRFRDLSAKLGDLRHNSRDFR